MDLFKTISGAAWPFHTNFKQTFAFTLSDAQYDKSKCPIKEIISAPSSGGKTNMFTLQLIIWFNSCLISQSCTVSPKTILVHENHLISVWIKCLIMFPLSFNLISCQYRSKYNRFSLSRGLNQWKSEIKALPPTFEYRSSTDLSSAHSALTNETQVKTVFFSSDAEDDVAVFLTDCLYWCRGCEKTGRGHYCHRSLNVWASSVYLPFRKTETGRTERRGAHSKSSSSFSSLASPHYIK